MIFLAVLLIKLYVLMMNISKHLFFTEKKNVLSKFIEVILEEYDYCKNLIKKQYKKKSSHVCRR